MLKLSRFFCEPPIFNYHFGNMSSKKESFIDILLVKRLKELREEKDLTQKELAKQLNLHSVTYLHYEKSQREPPLSVLVDMAKYFDVSTNYLLGLDDDY